MKFNSDIDIDFANRDQLIELLDVVPASMKKDGEVKRHNTGVYPTDIPYDPIRNICALDYTEAEERGYVKLDFLNVFVYKAVRDEAHLVELMREPVWEKLRDREFFEQIVHIGKHYTTMMEMPEPIDSIPRMMMFLAIIRPGKRHLIGKTWAEVSKTIWEQEDTGYSFKKSHSCAYAHLVVVHMNLLTENPMAFSLLE